MNPSPLFRRCIAAAIVCIASAAGAAYPDKPIRIIVPYPPGGSVEIVSRVISDRLAQALGQPVVVESKGGAAGNIGAHYVATQPADGYTLIMGTQSTHGTNNLLFKETRHDPVKDFEPITMVAAAPLLLVVNPKVAATDGKSLLQYIAGQKDGVSFGSASTGGGGHLAGERFKKLTGLNLVHVPYKGSGPLRSDLIAGHVPMSFDNMASALPAVQAGQLRALAVTSAARSSVAPDIPTMAEAGFPPVVLDTWYALFAPAGTPKPVVERLNQEVVKILQEPAVAERLRGLGMDVVTTTPEGLRTRVVEDTARYKRIIDDAKIEAQ
ncbi:tripartite tricarboxylate transporter substrate binding protein [Variovorax defluvii]|uniref:Tripartite tricarboxylate transporter substrate binding protein n=1 Tax=Variovorax defluvii TaxID=913761 RepID=A0ABP8H1R8_9BURK